jgi:hypothetical protein
LRRPLYPRKLPRLSPTGAAVKGQERPHALQKRFSPFAWKGTLNEHHREGLVAIATKIHYRTRVGVEGQDHDECAPLEDAAVDK